VYGVLFAGLINGAVLGLAPIYAATSAPADEPVAAAAAAAAFYAAMTIGGVITQFPSGALSDRVDRRLVVAALAALASAASFALAVTQPFSPGWLRLSLAFIWGAGALSFYGVAVAHAIDRAPHEQHARVMGGLLLIWAGGNVVGPPVAGLVMQAGIGSAGLFVYAGLGLAGLAFLQTRRLASREQVEPEQREPFATVHATSMAAAELDPRGEGPAEAETPSEPPRDDEPYTGEDPV
ncbi:MAG: MFS transporter, partial [Maricaulaceae bacterium]